MKQRARRGSRSCARSRSPFTRRRRSLSRATMPVSGPMVGSLTDPATGPVVDDRVRMHQERRAAFEIGAHQVDAALGLLPIRRDDVLELVVQKFLSRLFVGGIHLDEIRQHAQRTEVRHLAFWIALNSRFTESVV